VLKARGVEFRFFHRVTGLEVEGDRVVKIRVARQVNVLSGETGYQPLVSVPYRDRDGKPFKHDLQCWRSKPDFKQLENGQKLEQLGIDFENAETPLCAGELELRDGREFDHVVLAIPSSAFPDTCPELMVANPRIARMVEQLRHVSTQSYQVWLAKTLEDVGWQTMSPVMGSPVLGNFVDPLNTWSDMSQVLAAEHVQGARLVAYFCGAMSNSQLREDIDVSAAKLLNAMARFNWPNARLRYGAFFDRRLILSEYSRANTNPTDHYVLSVAGTTQYRLRADETGFKNLTFAGDWTRNGLNAGAVEAAVTSAMQASNHISGYPLRADIVRDSGL